MRRQVLVITAILAAAACGRGTVTWDGTPPGDRPGPGAGGGWAEGTGGGGGIPPALSDLPCDVAALLSSDCAGCHGATPQTGLLRLVTRSDLSAPSPVDPAHSVAQWALARIDAGQMPPPGSAPLADGGLAILVAWVAAGLPAGSCGVAGGDGGVVTWPSDGGAWDGGVLAGLPCDVADLVAAKCADCHAPGRAQVPLVSLDDFRAPSPTVPGLTLGESAWQKLAAGLMPPAGSGFQRVTAAELAAFGAWYDAGMPAGTCGAVDAGSGDGGLSCQTDRLWDAGNRESPDMNPGVACLACHFEPGRDSDKRYQFAGTIFPSLREKDLCIDPAPAGGTLELRDGFGNVVVLTVSGGSDRPGISSRSGNFHSAVDAGLKGPYTARLTLGGNVAEMTTPQVSGDCNGCHRPEGSADGGAYGRIVWP